MNSQSPSSSPSSPTPAAASNDQSKASTLPKDRPCPFCGQAFTSSSLGRHLDLYIREKNPKAPDGVHDVHAIRQMRRKITRRQPKGSGSASSNVAGHKRKASGELEDGVKDKEPPTAEEEYPRPHLQHAATAPATAGEARSTSQSASNSRPGLPDGQTNVHILGGASSDTINHIGIPRLAWQATGVINDLPPSMRSPPPNPFASPPKRSIQATASRGPESSGASDLTAMALKDILASLQRAHARVQRPPAFPNYDPFALNYPALVLRLLGPPPALFSTTPIHSTTQDSWPLDGPPTAALRNRLLHTLRNRLKLHTSLCPPTELRYARSHEDVERGIHKETEARYIAIASHLDAALAQWEGFSQPQREEVWRIEMLRFAARQTDEINEMVQKQEKTEDVVEELRQELARLRERNVALAQQQLLPVEPEYRANRAPAVNAQLMRAVLATDTAGGLGPGQGWLEGAGLEKWELENIMKRYKDIMEIEGGLKALWPGNGWRLQFYPGDEQTTNGVSESGPDTGSRNNADQQACDAELVSFANADFTKSRRLGLHDPANEAQYG